MNAAGYGIFITPADMDGVGRKLENVSWLRAQYVDLDGASALADYGRAASSVPLPSFGVHSSPEKRHVYWCVERYTGVDRFEQLQRKMRQVFNGDKAVIDAARVMRLPGTYNRKIPDAPHLVTCEALAGYGQRLTVEALEAAYATVQVIDGGSGERHALGDPEHAAPSLEWLVYGFSLIDPNALSRGEWIALTAAFKQSGWTLTDPDTLYRLWSEWCARYTGNDEAENHKQWHSLRNTELGWRSIVARVPQLRATMSFGAGGGAVTNADTPTMPANTGEYLTPEECSQWFDGCVAVTSMARILAPNGRFYDASGFNMAYGGKIFIITSEGKKTDEAWKAATRSTIWRVPHVDHVRFTPHMAHGAIVMDDLGRKGVNIYKPPLVELIEGDPSPFLNHLTALIPNDNDRNILLTYLAHNVQYPGHKIPWAPVIQSVEGAGKGIMKSLVQHAFGVPYIHFPKAEELTANGSKFNEWLRHKVFILADEIKVDDKRDLIEKLKPIISEKKIEFEGKGVNQDLDDNFANWMFFTNYKDAVPISKNGRRYAIFYSPLQTLADLLARGMDDAYFDALYGWFDMGGAAIVTNWLKNHVPIQRGVIPMRAPKTTSWDEALKVSRTPVERAIIEAIEQRLPGFANNWVSVQSAIQYVKDQNITRGTLAPHVVSGILETMGYVYSGRAPRPYFPEKIAADLFHYGQAGDVTLYGRAQGWE